MPEIKQPDVYITSPSPELLIVSALGLQTGQTGGGSWKVALDGMARFN